jgi:hypothetical protein
LTSLPTESTVEPPITRTVAKSPITSTKMKMKPIITPGMESAG